MLLLLLVLAILALLATFAYATDRNRWDLWPAVVLLALIEVIRGLGAVLP